MMIGWLPLIGEEVVAMTGIDFLPADTLTRGLLCQVLAFMLQRDWGGKNNTADGPQANDQGPTAASDPGGRPGPQGGGQ